FPAACPAPDGGWRIVDESTATQEGLHAASAVASTIDGFAAIWIDRSLMPVVPEGTDPLEHLRLEAVNAGSSIITVALRGDAAAAEQRLREVWGGALCVVSVDSTEQERHELLRAIFDEYVDRGMLSAGMDATTGL